MRVLVTGATGALGPAVVEALRAAGHEVSALLRGEAVPGLPSFRADITDPVGVERAMVGMDAVVHLAAVLHHTNVTPEIREAYRAVNVGGTENVVDAAQALGIERIVFGSTIAVYGYNRGMLLDETTPIQPDTDYARSKAEGEAIIRRAGGVVLRFGAIYGPRVKGNYRRLVTSLARGRFLPIGSGRNRRSVLYDEDAGQAVVAALGAGDAAGKIYNVAHRHNPTVREIVEAISAALGRRPPLFYIPEEIVRPPIALAEKILRHPPITTAMLDKYLEDVTVSSAKIERELGFVAAHDIQAGWKATVHVLRVAGEM